MMAMEKLNSAVKANKKSGKLEIKFPRVSIEIAFKIAAGDAS